MSLKCVRCVRMCERGGRLTCVSACEHGRTYFNFPDLLLTKLSICSRSSLNPPYGILTILDTTDTTDRRITEVPIGEPYEQT